MVKTVAKVPPDGRVLYRDEYIPIRQVHGVSYIPQCVSGVHNVLDASREHFPDESDQRPGNEI